MYAYVLGVKKNFRGETLIKDLTAQGFKTIVIEGPDLSDEKDRVEVSSYINQKYAKFTIRRLVKPQEIACTIGHMRMFKKHLESSDDWALFLEDDAILKSGLRDFVSQLKSTKHPTQIFVHDGPGTNLSKIKILRDELNNNQKMLRIFDPNYGAYGYLLNRKGIEAILNSQSIKYINTPDWPYAWPIFMRFYKTREIYISHPPEGPSIIGQRVNSKNSMWYQIPNPVRFIYGIALGLRLTTLFYREIYSKTIRILKQTHRKMCR